MRYVILRDDDTCAFTPIDCLERLYRPFLERGLPVNLAVIPLVRTDAVRPDGRPEEFLFGKANGSPCTVPIAENEALVRYLRSEPGCRVVQHGCHHSPNEFDSGPASDLARRLAAGADALAAAGLGHPDTFVAPYDQYSRAGFREITRRFGVFSTGWFELRRLPVTCWPQYALNKLLRRRHWRIGRTLLLSHPGCLLSRYRPRERILETVREAVGAAQLTVLVTHWWEYFVQGKPEERFIRVLHDTACWLADQDDLKVVAFSDLQAARRGVGASGLSRGPRSMGLAEPATEKTPGADAVYPRPGRDLHSTTNS